MYTWLTPRSGTSYQGDSFGYGSYINVDEERPCTSHCFCRKHHLEEAFTFKVYKSVNQMHTTIYSHSLYDKLATLIPLDNIESGLGCPARIVNGLALLRHYHTLMRLLKDLRSTLCDNPANQSLALEMDLLVNGFLGDGQVFQSFGYENLYELGFMDYQLWKYFQKQKIDKDITALDDGFCAIDDEEALSTSGSESRSITTFVEEAMADGAVEDLTEPLLDIDETQGPFSRPAGTDNPEVYISTALHMTDGPDAHRYSHPSAISDFSQLSGASHQGDENVLASLCPPISGKLRRGLEQTLLNKELYLAVRAADEGRVRLFLDRGANVNKDYSEDLPLCLAIEAGHEEIVQLLLDRGADMNKAYRWKDPPLPLAARAGHEGIVRLLLDRGPNVNRVNCLGNPPLSLAAGAGHGGIVRLLLDYGADVNRENFLGVPPLSIAARAGHEGIVRLLLDCGADVNRENFFGTLPLLLATEAGHEGIIRLLLDRGANVNNVDYFGNPPLSLAARAGHEGIVRLLLDRGADVIRADGLGNPPLLLATEAGHEGIAQLLYEAKINALASGTALIMAVKQRNVNFVRLLIREGADVQAAALYLQGEGGNHMQWLLKVAWASSGATNVGKKKNWQSTDSDASENNRHLRLKFVGQYMLMTKSAQNSQTRLRDLPRQFHNYREAWRAGIETMRELSRGETPRGVYETLAFLSLGRAIVETLRDRKNCDYLEDFEQDLGRWGQLFKNAEDLEAYEEALNLMWGVVYNESTSRERGGMDEDTLIRFQELASTLVGRANDLLGFEASHDRRSEHYQQGWPKTGQIPIEDVPHRFSDHRNPGAKSSSQLEATPLQHLNPSNILDSMKTDTSSFEPVVLLLVAGAIFAVVVMFLEGTSKR
jgi:ankyrin repeat protein